MLKIVEFAGVIILFMLFGYCLYKGACDRFKLLEKIFATFSTSEYKCQKK
ncbi:hypothetical protein JXA70_09175 [candidate division KSB1 bacterium]|nr:hypothetical protein [candidate division KSB1 bacterium]